METDWLIIEPNAGRGIQAGKLFTGLTEIVKSMSQLHESKHGPRSAFHQGITSVMKCCELMGYMYLSYFNTISWHIWWNMLVLQVVWNKSIYEWDIIKRSHQKSVLDSNQPAPLHYVSAWPNEGGWIGHFNLSCDLNFFSVCANSENVVILVWLWKITFVFAYLKFKFELRFYMQKDFWFNWTSKKVHELLINDLNLNWSESVFLELCSCVSCLFIWKNIFTTEAAHKVYFSHFTLNNIGLKI